MVMREISDRELTIEERTTPQVESTDAAYFVWRDERVRRTMEKDRADPTRRIPQRDVWKRFGFEP